MALAAISEADAGALTSVFGALLAAYGFFFTGIKSAVDGGLVKDPGTPESREELRGLIREALWPGMALLSIASVVVFGLMLPPLVEVLRSMEPSKDYSAPKAAFGTLAVFWGLLAAFWLAQSLRAAYRLKRWR